MTRFKIRRLPKSTNGVRRKTASLACYAYQKEELQKRARKKKMSVSFYLNYLLWRDWVDVRE